MLIYEYDYLQIKKYDRICDEAQEKSGFKQRLESMEIFKDNFEFCNNENNDNDNFNNNSNSKNNNNNDNDNNSIYRTVNGETNNRLNNTGITMIAALEIIKLNTGKEN